MSESSPSHRRSLLEAAIQALPVGIVVHDEQGVCILANAAARALGPMAVHDLPEAGLRQFDEAVVEEIGERMVETRARPVVAEQETYTLTTLADVTHHHTIQRDLIARAFIDALTGLPNRTMFEQSIEELVAEATPADRFALAFIDLDNFKHIND